MSDVRKNVRKDQTWSKLGQHRQRRSQSQTFGRTSHAQTQTYHSGFRVAFTEAFYREGGLSGLFENGKPVGAVWPADGEEPASESPAVAAAMQRVNTLLDYLTGGRNEKENAARLAALDAVRKGRKTSARGAARKAGLSHGTVNAHIAVIRGLLENPKLSTSTGSKAAETVHSPQ